MRLQGRFSHPNEAPAAGPLPSRYRFTRSSGLGAGYRIRSMIPDARRLAIDPLGDHLRGLGRTAASRAASSRDRLLADFLKCVRAAISARWQDIPGAGRSGYFALSGGDDPNVLLKLDPPTSARMAMGIRRRESTLGLRLESPGAFVAAVERARHVRHRQTRPRQQPLA